MSDTTPTASPSTPTCPDGYTQWSFWILAATILLLGVTVLVAKAVLYAIARWCPASPKLPAYAPDDLSQGCANARAARIRRAQDAVDKLFAAPSPEEASFARFRGAGGYATEAAWV